MRSNQLVTYRVSPKAGHIKTGWVQEARADGWVRASQDYNLTVQGGTWVAPHNVIGLFTPQSAYDYGGISEGTLVQVWDKTGVVIRRRGARYDVLVEGRVADYPWDAVRPMEDRSEEG
jgi:hypothetical protein